MSELDDAKGIELVQNTLDKMEELLTTSQNQPERDFLKMRSHAFSKMLKAFEIKDEKKRKDAIREAFVSVAPEQKAFFQKYIQSSQLRGAVLAFQDLAQERMYLEQYPEKQLERKAHEAKIVSLSKQLITLYDNPNLDVQTKAEFVALDKIGLLPQEMIESLRGFATADSPFLSASTPDLSEKASLRRARQDGAEVDFSQLMMNGVAGGYAPLSLPVYVQLKGSIEGSKDTRDLTGVAVCKFDHMLVGVIHGYANASKNSDSTLNHNETSAVISRSFGNAYLEGQAGFIHSTINQQDISGERYQLSAGYDFEYLTPFVQASTRNLNAVNEHSVQAGCEVDVLNLVTDQYKLSTRMTLKGGYHSFKGAVGSVEGSGTIQLNDGLKLDAALNLAGREESSARIGFSIDQ